MYERDITLNEWLLASLLKRNTGYLVEWNNNLFKKVPETEGSGPNGIALDEKSNIIYINYNQGDKIVGFDLLKNKKIKTFAHNGYWLDIGQHEDYKKAQHDVKT